MDYFFLMDGCIILGFKTQPPIHNRYNPWRTKDIFKYISNYVRLKDRLRVSKSWDNFHFWVN